MDLNLNLSALTECFIIFHKNATDMTGPQSTSGLTLSTVGDCDLPGRLSSLGAEALDLLDDIHPLHNLAEHHVLAIQPLGLSGADEELGAVSVWSSIGHRENS